MTKVSQVRRAKSWSAAFFIMGAAIAGCVDAPLASSDGDGGDDDDIDAVGESVVEESLVSPECEENACTESDACSTKKATYYRCIRGVCACTTANTPTCGAVGVCAAPQCSTTCSASSSCASTNYCEDGGRVMSCDDYGVCDRGTCPSYCAGGYAIRQCSASCTAGGGLATTCGAMGYQCIGGIEPSMSPPPDCSICTSQSNPSWQCIENGANSTCGAHHVYAPQPARGLKTTSVLTDANRCVNNPVAQVTQLSIDGSGFDVDYPGVPAINQCHVHVQSMQRLPNDDAAFVMSMSTTSGAGFLGAGRSASGYMGDVVWNTTWNVGDDRYNHAGGAQMLGDYFFVALENSDKDVGGAIGIWKVVTSTSSPPTVSFNTTGNNIWKLMPAGVNGAGEVAAVKLAPFPGESASRFAFVAAGENATENLHFFLSAAGASLDNGAWQFEHQGVLPVRAANDDWLYGWSDFQNYNIVTDCSSGQLYLVTMSRDGDPDSCTDGDDYVKIFKLDMLFDPITQTLSGFSIGNGPLAAQHMYCHGSCNFDAGAGVYVGPGGSLNVYATAFAPPPLFPYYPYTPGPLGLREFATP